MGKRSQEFPRKTQELALLRQQGLCASCGTPISHIGEAGRARHKFGEGAQAHHAKHVKFGGTNDLDNCVVIVSRAITAFTRGGNYRFGTIVGMPSDFPHYHGLDQPTKK